MRNITNYLVYRLSPVHLVSNVHFYWQSRDHSSAVFAVIFISIFSGVGAFIFHTIKIQEQAKEIRCLTLNIYHEARGEPDEGKYAVASVTLNRVTSKHYPGTICKVVYQKRWDYLRNRYVSAFSWTELDAPFSTDDKSWIKAARIAEDVYHNPDAQNLKQALFYHARHIRPSWARKKVSVARIGRHIFYN